jgi:type I restriction enzyme S subunit
MTAETQNNNLPKGWRKVKLGELCEIKRGASPRPILKFIGGNVPWIKISDATETYSRFITETKEKIIEEGKKKSVFLPKGSLILANSGQVGFPKLLGVDGCVHDGWLWFSNYKNIDKMFLFYYLEFKKNLLKNIADGSTQKNLNTSILENLEVLIPDDINEQKRIADILSAFDDKIEVNNKIIKTLEEMAQEIFREWFNENSKFKSQKSKLWETIKISDLTWIISGYPFSSKLYNKSKKGLGVVTIKNVQDGNFITECDSFIEEKKIPKNMSQECLISDGDILLSLTGNVGRVCFVYGGKYLLNQRVAKLKPKNPNDLAFIYFLFRQPNIQNLLVNMAKGSAQPNLSPVETGEIEITIPTREILDKLNKIINPMYEKLIKLKVENQKLAELRDLLLPKLMSGEIRV